MGSVPVTSSRDDATGSPEREPAPSSARLLALDVVRGITIAGMLLVNNPGSWQHIYAPLEHAAWNGWTPTDLIFPFFIFIVGVAITYSLGKASEQGSSRRDLRLKTAKRALLIFLVGLALHSFPWWGYDYAHLRIPGVLQRIAIAYLFAAVLYLHTGVRGQVATIVALLLGYGPSRVGCLCQVLQRRYSSQEGISVHTSIVRSLRRIICGKTRRHGIRKGC